MLRRRQAWFSFKLNKLGGYKWSIVENCSILLTLRYSSFVDQRGFVIWATFILIMQIARSFENPFVLAIVESNSRLIRNIICLKCCWCWSIVKELLSIGHMVLILPMICIHMVGFVTLTTLHSGFAISFALWNDSSSKPPYSIVKSNYWSSHLIDSCTMH